MYPQQRRTNWNFTSVWQPVSCCIVSTLTLVFATPVSSELDFSIEYSGSVNIDEYFPSTIGTWWEYREIYKTAVGPDQKHVELQWTHRDTVSGKYTIPEGLLVEVASTNSQIEYSDKLDADTRKWLDTLPEQYRHHWLIKGNYVYELPAAVWDTKTKKINDDYAVRIREGEFRPDFFFPMDKVKYWSEPARERAELEKARLWKAGKGPAPNPALWFWHVEGREKISTPAGDFPNAYQLVCRFNTGPIFVWFQPGIGVIKRKTVHGGSYEESESILKNWNLGKSNH